MVHHQKNYPHHRAILSSYRARTRDLWSKKEQLENKFALKKLSQIQQQYENDAEDEIGNALQFKLLSSKVERDIMQEVAFTSQLLNQLHHMTKYISNPNHDP